MVVLNSLLHQGGESTRSHALRIWIMFDNRIWKLASNIWSSCRGTVRHTEREDFASTRTVEQNGENFYQNRAFKHQQTLCQQKNAILDYRSYTNVCSTFKKSLTTTLVWCCGTLRIFPQSKDSLTHFGQHYWVTAAKKHPDTISWPRNFSGSQQRR
jgi:hypothetical protein